MANNDNPARKKFEPMLSPFVDGELTPEERTQVEQHLAANKESAMQVADFRAASGLMRLTFEQQADQEDWSDFSNQVLAKLTPEKPPFFERLKTSFIEMMQYQQRVLVGGFATAAALVAVATVAFTMGMGRGAGYGGEQMAVQTVKVDEGARVAPVVMETDNGDAIIWMVDDPSKKTDEEKKNEKKPGEESEELGGDEEPKKAGDL